MEQAAETAQQNNVLNNDEQNVTNTQQTTKTQRAGQAQYEGGGVSENVEIDRQNPVSRVENGTVYLRTQDGSDVRASDVTFGDERDNLLAAEGVHRMSTSGINGMLENYDAGKATAEEYAKAYMAVYNRARAGMNVQQAVYDSQQTQNALTQEAAMAAYAAGERMQTVKIIPMTREEKTRRDAQLKLVEAINQKFAKTGVKIEMVDRIEGYGGQEMNGRWDSQTNTIQVSKNASENAYAYIAMHELTHALKSQNASEFEGFSDWVTYYLNENGQDADALVRSEMIARAQAMGLMERQKSNLSVEEQVKLLDSLSEEQYRQLNELAQEEVVCNTVPAILQNENVLMDLYQTKPTLFEKIKNFLKDFIDAVRGTGKDLSRTRAFQQMEGLAKDTAALEDIYNRMVKMAENGAQEKEETTIVKYSPKEQNEEIQHVKDQLRENKEKINQMPLAASIWTEGRKGKATVQLVNEILEEYKASGYQVERMGYGTVLFGKKEIENAMHYVNSDEEYAAILAAKKVVKRGIEIHNHANHKGRNYLSVTFAAPVEINGVKGMEAVVIKQTKGNRFSVARIIAPDGTAFVFKNKKDAEPTIGGGRPTTEAAAVYTPISSTSETSISDSGEKFNEKFSMKEDGDFEYDEDSNLTREQQRQVATPEFKRWFGKSKVVDEEGMLSAIYYCYRHACVRGSKCDSFHLQNICLLPKHQSAFYSKTTFVPIAPNSPYQNTGREDYR